MRQNYIIHYLYILLFSIFAFQSVAHLRAQVQLRRHFRLCSPHPLLLPL